MSKKQQDRADAGKHGYKYPRVPYQIELYQSLLADAYAVITGLDQSMN
jgi:hypothetical protein